MMRIGRCVAAGALIAAGVVLVGPSSAGANNTTTARIAGVDRYDTAAQVAEAKFPNGVGTVVMASGLSFADALAGAYLAGLGGVKGATGPAGILLTDPNAVPATVTNALTTLHVHNVVLLGGESAISAAVANQLSGMGLQVTRLFGASRFDTMAAIDQFFGPDVVGTVGGKRTAIVVSGLNFPDALSAGGAGYGKHLPIVLTLPDQLSAQAAQTLQALGIQQVLILGGSSAVSPAIESALSGMGIAVAQRFAGKDRTDTAAQFGTYEIATLGFSAQSVVVVRGDGFADALAGAQYTGDPRTIAMLETPVELGAFGAAYLNAHKDTIDQMVALGGTGSISPAAFASAASAANGVFVTGAAPSELDKATPETLTVTGGGFTEGTGTPAVVIGPSASNTNPRPDSCSQDLSGTTANVMSDTTLTTTFVVPADCPAGSYSLFLSTFNSGVVAAATNEFDCEGCLDVSDTAATNPVQSISPSAIPDDDSTVDVTISGRGFAASSVAFISPSADNKTLPSGPCGDSANAIDVQGQAVAVDGSQITGTLSVPFGCPPGKWDVSVDNHPSGGQLNTCTDCLTVTSSQPPSAVEVSSCSPSSIPVGGEPFTGGTGEEVKIFGSGFNTAHEWELTDAAGDPGPFVNDQNFVSDQEIDIFISPTADDVGSWDVDIKDPTDSSKVIATKPGCLTITQPTSPSGP